MTNNPTLLGYLGRALSFEFSAVQQYLALSRFFEMRGIQVAAERFRREAHEEMQHAERIITRMIILGYAPNATCLKPAKLGGSLSQLIQHAEDLEKEISALYSQAVSYCVQTQDCENRIFFEALLREEMAHAAEISVWRQELIAGQPPT